MWRSLTAIIILAGTTQAQDRAAQHFSVYVPPRISVAADDREAGKLPSWTVESTNAGGLGLLVEQNSATTPVPIRWQTSHHIERVVDGAQLIIVPSTGRSTISLNETSPNHPVTLTITFLAP